MDDIYPADSRFDLSASSVDKFLSNVDSEHLQGYFLQLVKKGAFRQHVSYNLRCITHILESRGIYDHESISKQISEFSGVITLSTCLKNWFEYDKLGARILNTSDLYSVTMMCNIIKFVLDSETSQIYAVIQNKIVESITEILRLAGASELDDLNGVFSLIELLIVKYPTHISTFDIIPVVFSKFTNVNLFDSIMYSILRVLIAAINLPLFRQIVLNHISSYPVVDKLVTAFPVHFGNQVEDIDGFRTKSISRNTIICYVSFLTMAAQTNPNIKKSFQNENLLSLLGRSVKHFCFRPFIIDVVDKSIEQIFFSNNEANHDTEFSFSTVISSFKSSLADVVVYDIAGSLYAIIAYGSTPLGKAFCVRSEVVASVLSTLSQFQDYPALVELALDLLSLIAGDEVGLRALLRMGYNIILTYKRIGIVQMYYTDFHMILSPPPR